MKCIFCNPKEGVKVMEIEPKLEEYYKLIDCRYIDIPMRMVGGVPVDIICDDEGLLVDNPIPSAVNGKGEPMLCGNLILCSHDDEGNEVSLSDKDIDTIMSNCQALGAYQAKPVWLLTDVEYC